ncbi:hypothetical protein IRZ71_19435 [Flavobacterium sp. ANB]|uniref:hypothetical protein n=1 Tax=unclassified Flavobacterium TaxID=196869 RepID=UPI0012B9FD4D|nr:MULTISPECIES: hypothetical protein [unclassified Flavobacterium]MBF4518536.1 hypothetical protein [Flavobacterium sp. ANB]MTD67958.1 hypothetical protein [Flavobacterium sp. LC2016-13]
MKIITDYSNNYNKPEFSFDYVDKKLNPTLIKIQAIVCETKDKELLEEFLEMIIRSSGSANESPADVLGNIFICNPEIVEEQLSKYKNHILFDYLELGFYNITMYWPLNDKNADLQIRMNKLIAQKDSKR